MVKYGTILKVIEDELDKCWSKKEIRAKLSKLSEDEKEERLKSLVTDLQFNVYNEWKEKRADLERTIQNRIEDDEDFWKEDIRRYREDLLFCDEVIFNVERKLYEKQKPVEKYDYPKTEYDYDTQKELEDNQIKHQENIDYTDNQVKSLKSYFGMGFTTLNSYLYGYGEWNMYPKQKQKSIGEKLNAQSKEISNAMKKTGAISDMTVYRGGLFDPSKGVGDNISFKGYSSCSFSEPVGYSFATTSGGKRLPMKVKYKIILPKGAPCISGNSKVNGERLSNFSREQELLLDKNFKGKIVDITGDVVTIQAT